MMATELVVSLVDLIKRHGADFEVMVDCGVDGCDGLQRVHECDLDADENGFVLWLESGE